MRILMKLCRLVCVAICGAFFIVLYPVYASEESNQAQIEDAGYPVYYEKQIFHCHTGGSNGGGCYNVANTGSRKVTVNCNGSMHYWPDLDTSQCSRCGASYHGDQSHRKCWHSKTKTEHYTYYTLGCGKDDGTLLGNIYLEQSTDAWTTKLTLSASYDVVEGMVVAEKPYIWNKGEASDNNTYEVSESGVYTLQLNADANSNTQAALITVDIRNVDVTAPVVKAHLQEPLEEWTKEGVIVTLTEVCDLQPDGTEGCGLHEQPYSYDNGENWTSDNYHVYMENGTHSVLVRDQLLNTSTYEVSFQNVDCTSPTIHSIVYDETKNIRETTLTVEAEDLQPDGSIGCGLHELPYSYDGGVSWTDETSIVIRENVTINFVVRDQLENQTVREVAITNIDCYGPTIHYRMKEKNWTNKDVKLYLSAKDLNLDGTEGIGLKEPWYSLDGGNSWSNEPILVFEKNTEIEVMARDLHDNYSKQRIKIKQIDKEEPWVTLRAEVSGSGRDKVVTLIAEAGDDYSGLAEDAFSWDKGCSYGKENTKVVTENGVYQITVIDKAGNWSYALLTVEEFAFLDVFFPVLDMRTTEIEETCMEETLEAVSETEVEPEILVREPTDEIIYSIEREEAGIGNAIKVVAAILSLLGLLLLFLLWYRLIFFYFEIDGEYELVGVFWIHKKEQVFMIKIADKYMERCTTTHFMFCPSKLFAHIHENDHLNIIFPDEVSIVRSIESEIEVLLQ